MTYLQVVVVREAVLFKQSSSKTATEIGRNIHSLGLDTVSVSTTEHLAETVTVTPAGTPGITNGPVGGGAVATPAVERDGVIRVLPVVEGKIGDAADLNHTSGHHAWFYNNLIDFK